MNKNHGTGCIVTLCKKPAVNHHIFHQNREIFFLLRNIMTRKQKRGKIGTVQKITQKYAHEW